MKIAFFGTPDFAVPSLRALLGEGFDVIAVVTQPDKPHGRKRSELIPPPIKIVALEEELPVLQPPRPSDPDFVQQLESLAPDIGVVVAYGHILKPDLLAVPRLGLINVHASLLPRLRGAAPIQHAILEGFTESGISIMRIEEGLDSGPVLQRVATPIADDETFGELSVRLAELGALALIEGLELIALEETNWEPQDDAAATFAPKITRETARMDWSRPSAAIARHVRSMDPAPGAWTQPAGEPVTLVGPLAADGPRDGGANGEIVETRPALIVTTTDGALQFLDVQPSGSRRMAASEWVRGRGGTVGQRFE